MYIQSISLFNFRAYQGLNTVNFDKNGKNIFVIAGNNGFGKTTFLTSLVWCLYGKLMVDVDDKFRREINDAQGYKHYVKENLNRALLAQLNELQISQEQKKSISRNGYGAETFHIQRIAVCSVEVSLTDVFIPSIPCNSITIKRSYDCLLEAESLEVLIDGEVNELAKDVGYDIFINDFILSKDIAKFFFFDAEKIVSLAEIKSLEEKRKLSFAYSEVLGIKKYEDIRRSLESLRIKFRKNSGSSSTVVKLTELQNDVDGIETTIKAKDIRRSSLDDEIQAAKLERDSLQERLIREGNAMSIDELQRQKDLLATLKQKNVELHQKLKDMMDIAPFAVSGYLLEKMKLQIEQEKKLRSESANYAAVNAALDTTYKTIENGLGSMALSSGQLDQLMNVINVAFASNYATSTFSADKQQTKVLLDFSDSDINAFQALYDNLKYSFRVVFKQLVKDIKNNQSFLTKTQKKINAAEHDDGNAEVKSLRAKKEEIDALISNKELESRNLSESLGILSRDLTIRKKQLSELAKTIRVDAMDEDKDRIAERLINELTVFLASLKEKRKTSLETGIKSEIDVLMHKADFIKDVRIDLSEDLIDINLIDNAGEVIGKEKLSKGEQQLYATSILKALVDESGIDFPVFIDSPLQKFDSIHSKNIITKFYPSVSKQVVIFPLLGKELSQEEYQSLLPNVNKAYYIHNEKGISSLKEIVPDQLFETIN